jgi:hypothetical protein
MLSDIWVQDRNPEKTGVKSPDPGYGSATLGLRKFYITLKTTQNLNFACCLYF